MTTIVINFRIPVIMITRLNFTTDVFVHTLNARQLHWNLCSGICLFLVVSKNAKCKNPRGCFGLGLHLTTIMFLVTLCTRGPVVSVASNQIACLVSLDTCNEFRMEFFSVSGVASCSQPMAARM